MLYILGSIICLSALVLTLKISAIRKANNYHVILCNYIIAFGVTLLTNLLNGSVGIFGEIKNVDLSQIFTEKTLAGSSVIILGMGLICGIAFPSNLFLMNNSTQSNGSGLTSFFKQMSTIGGLFFAVAVLGERPTWIQWIGIILIIAAIVLMVVDFKRLKINKGNVLFFILLTGCVMEIGNKVISGLTVSGYSNVYLMVVFFTSLIFSAIFITRKSGNIFANFTLKDIIYGIIMGSANMLNNFFKIQAMTELPAAIVIPCVAAGSLFFTNMVGILFFREKANKMYIIALIISIISLFLL